ncbi:MAG TPA: hypothetical protein VHO70_19150 [Chitinispirillaceae bacterium]|nr:hypothetical protein [Chitinispirillaceae bacterium]
MTQSVTIQQSELMGLLVAIPMIIAILLLCRRVLSRYNVMILASALFAFLSSLFTVLEGLTPGNLFNLMEHACYGFTGISFGLGCYLMAVKDKINISDRL